MSEEKQKLEDLLEKNLQISQEIKVMTKRTRKWIVFQQIWFGLQVVVILLVIASALIYVPPFIKSLGNLYENFTKSSPSNLINSLFQENQTKNLQDLSQEEIDNLIQQYTK
ncbi:MAG: hypothetical protein PHS07_01300 [Patescibacteria group bacterium]|nr:hypothetical protein [Patescibacteria group bacterium]